MTEGDACPHCSVDLFEYLMGHEIWGVYDGTLFWSCRRCGFSWVREAHAGTRRGQIAQQYVNERNDVLYIQEQFCQANHWL